MNPAMDAITTYFSEERIQSLCMGIIGVTAILLALMFLFIIKYSFFKGLAVPLLMVGIIQLTVGTVVFVRSPKDLIRVQEFIEQYPQKIQTEELPRLEKVIHHFTIYKWIELSVMFMAIVLICVFYNSSQTFWKGLGLGLLLQAGLVFVVDVVSEKRAEVYREQLLSVFEALAEHH
ncbi:MAG: hypothetical protein HY062_11855 [Bacteroidetes bacterium]|nr:hypothetical protein [Bacteroidota bacterium]